MDTLFTPNLEIWKLETYFSHVRL